MRFTRASLFVPAIALLACGAAMAQSPTYKVGRPPTEAELRAWDNVVGPDGKELPPGAGTAKEGAKVYAGKCSFCHGQTGTEGPAPRLVGGVDTAFHAQSSADSWELLAVRDDGVGLYQPLHAARRGGISYS